jgi:serine/threonine protein kinase
LIIFRLSGMPGRQSDYTVVQQIGVGSFGTCCLVKRLADGQKFVWKEVRYGNMREAEKESLVREVNLLRDLRHPHIVRYIDRIVSKSSSTLYLGNLIPSCNLTN